MVPCHINQSVYSATRDEGEGGNGASSRLIMSAADASRLTPSQKRSIQPKQQILPSPFLSGSIHRTEVDAERTATHIFPNPRSDTSFFFHAPVPRIELTRGFARPQTGRRRFASRTIDRRDGSIRPSRIFFLRPANARLLFALGFFFDCASPW